MTFTRALATNNYGPAKFIVDGTTTANGTHSTIATALTSASSGDTIFIRPGTYTENLTLKAGVNLTAFGSDASLNGTGKVIISGTCTMTTAGSVTISGIQLQTNSAALLAVTGSAASIVNVTNCYLNMTNNTGITYSSSDATSAINITNCAGDLGTTGIGFWTCTAAGTLNLKTSTFTNTGASTTASTNSATSIFIFHCSLFAPLSSSSTGLYQIHNSVISTSAQNATCLTTAGTQGNNSSDNSTYASGSASAISIGVGTTLNMSLCNISSTNTNAVTGAGILINGGLSFSNSSSLINTTTQTARNIDVGGISFDGGTNVLSSYTVGTFTPTMVGTVAGSTTYTAQNGYYVRIGASVQIQALVSGSAATGTGTAIFGALPFTIKNQTNGIPVGSILDQNNATWTWPAGTTSLAFFGTVNATTANIYVSGTATTGGSLQMANAAFTFYYTLIHQI